MKTTIAIKPTRKHYKNNKNELEFCFVNSFKNIAKSIEKKYI